MTDYRMVLLSHSQTVFTGLVPGASVLLLFSVLLVIITVVVIAVILFKALMKKPKLRFVISSYMYKLYKEIYPQSNLLSYEIMKQSEVDEFNIISHNCNTL